MFYAWFLGVFGIYRQGISRKDEHNLAPQSLFLIYQCFADFLYSNTIRIASTLNGSTDKSIL
jgi:hypothetical protein